mmetsp:Transcript_7500/g.21535  ORF Transcript_7500/g.21535 Transcript_7500/m.21535 type:complete len:154 (-) Transcript_7500:375-836(-)
MGSIHPSMHPSVCPSIGVDLQLIQVSHEIRCKQSRQGWDAIDGTRVCESVGVSVCAYSKSIHPSSKTYGQTSLAACREPYVLTEAAQLPLCFIIIPWKSHASHPTHQTHSHTQGRLVSPSAKIRAAPHMWMGPIRRHSLVIDSRYDRHVLGEG